MALTREQALDGLDFLARVEHSLCVEYLTVHAALGHDLGPADDGEPAAHVAGAAGAAFSSAFGEMSHFANVNSALVHAGRPPQVGRASSIRRASGQEVDLGPPGAQQLEHVVEREQEIAAAVDELYARLRPAVTPPGAVFEGDLLDELRDLLDPGPDHSVLPAALRAELDGIPAGRFLRATPHDPDDELGRSLLELGDRFYGVLVDVLESDFASGGLFGAARSTMTGLHEIDRLLVERGLLPRFTALDTVPDPS